MYIFNNYWACVYPIQSSFGCLFAKLTVPSQFQLKAGTAVITFNISNALRY